jgi:hypothetical protein
MPLVSPPKRAAQPEPQQERADDDADEGEHGFAIHQDASQHGWLLNPDVGCGRGVRVWYGAEVVVGIAVRVFAQSDSGVRVGVWTEMTVCGTSTVTAAPLPLAGEEVGEPE